MAKDETVTSQKVSQAHGKILHCTPLVCKETKLKPQYDSTTHPSGPTLEDPTHLPKEEKIQSHPPGQGPDHKQLGSFLNG